MEKAILELKQRRAKLVADARKIYDEAAKSSRLLTADEKRQTESMMADSDALNDQIKGMENTFAAERELNASMGRKVDGADFDSVDRKAQDVIFNLCDKVLAKKGADMQKFLDSLPTRDLKRKHMEAVRLSLISGRPSADLELADTIARKDYQIDLPSQGGYLLPVEVSSNILLKLLNQVHIRSKATVMPLNSYAVEIPALDEEPSQPSASGEISTVATDTAGKIGRRALKPHLMPITIKIARDLMRFAPTFESLLVNRAAMGFERKEESYFATGNGAGQPLGLFTSFGATGYAGVPADRDVVCGSTSAVTFDGIIDLEMSMPAQYRANGSFFMHRSTVKQIRQLKDNIGQYLWQPSHIVGQPDTIDGFPVLESEYAPNTYTTGKPVIIFGDLSYYWIAQYIGFEVQPLLEKYADTNELGFVCRQWVDGQPMLAEAFRRGVLA